MKEKFPSVYLTVQILHFFKKVFSATAKSKKREGRGRKRVDFFHGDRSKGLSTPLEKKRQMSPRLWESGVTHFSAFFFSLIDDEKKSGKKRTFPIFPDSASHRKKGPIAKVTLQKITLFFSICSSDSIRLFFWPEIDSGKKAWYSKSPRDR